MKYQFLPQFITIVFAMGGYLFFFLAGSLSANSVLWAAASVVMLIVYTAMHFSLVKILSRGPSETGHLIRSSPRN